MFARGPVPVAHLARLRNGAGAVGGTARWVADRFLEAIAHQLIDTKNCQTSEGIQQEILKIVDVSLQSRFYSDPKTVALPTQLFFLFQHLYCL